ncbi:hypothetical protein EUGRSUZ_C02163 [Eucalyptus grandis]|uniref:Uncharacterized protein n=2 Tax=Eucalyptus grandis TaxID=71139 RepID=A0ACC3LES2_EUCGR|nr:hypothetical protein EUGRSUZ_C02163 [Eucalyptus grandis]
MNIFIIHENVCVDIKIHLRSDDTPSGWRRITTVVFPPFLFKPKDRHHQTPRTQGISIGIERWQFIPPPPGVVRVSLQGVGLELRTRVEDKDRQLLAWAFI